MQYFLCIDKYKAIWSVFHHDCIVLYILEISYKIINSIFHINNYLHFFNIIINFLLDKSVSVYRLIYLFKYNNKYTINIIYFFISYYIYSYLIKLLNLLISIHLKSRIIYALLSLINLHKKFLYFLYFFIFSLFLYSFLVSHDPAK